MPQETSSSKPDELLPSSNLNPEDFELPSAEPTSLEPRRKPAGKPTVKTKKSIAARKRVVAPDPGKVTLVIH
jgi:hypothetical protein